MQLICSERNLSILELKRKWLTFSMVWPKNSPTPFLPWARTVLSFMITDLPMTFWSRRARWISSSWVNSHLLDRSVDYPHKRNSIDSMSLMSTYNLFLPIELLTASFGPSKKSTTSDTLCLLKISLTTSVLIINKWLPSGSPAFCPWSLSFMVRTNS